MAWRTGGPNCVTVPDWQVHEYNQDFYILRESGCINYEKPFLYLIFGEKRSSYFPEDTGAGDVCKPRPSFWVFWTSGPNTRTSMHRFQLIVIHSHGHGDHTAGDKQFAGTPQCAIHSGHAG